MEITMPAKTNSSTPKRATKNNPTQDELLEIVRQQRKQTHFNATEKAMIEAGRNFIAALIRQEEKETASAV